MTLAECQRRLRLATVLLVLCCAAPLTHVHAADFEVLTVDGNWEQRVYEVSAKVLCPLSEQAKEALQKGVVLTIVLDIIVARERRYWLNENIATLEQRYQLRYHALTDQYMVTNLNSGVQSNLPTLATALDSLGDVEALPVVDRRLLDPEERYEGHIRVRLDTNSLPGPIRWLAYMLPGWRLSSDWYSWKIQM